MSVFKSVRAVAEVVPYQDRAKLKAAMRGAGDCPLLPSSESDAAPVLPEEAGDNLTPQQRLAVAAIVGGQSFSAAARAAGCGRRTLFGWRQQPAFAAAVERTSREALDVTVIRVRNLMLRATRVLGEAMLERHDAPSHAFRVLNSNRLWTTATTSSADLSSGDSAPIDPPVDDVTADARASTDA